MIYRYVCIECLDERTRNETSLEGDFSLENTRWIIFMHINYFPRLSQ